jgi:hypothetical protein
VGSRFTRKELRDATGLGDSQLKVHLARLVDLEHVAVSGPARPPPTSCRRRGHAYDLIGRPGTYRPVPEGDRPAIGRSVRATSAGYRPVG